VTRVAVVARGAVSPLGVGDAATAIGALGEVPPTLVREDPALRSAGLAKPRAARVPLATPSDTDRAHVLLDAAARELVARLDRVLPGWRKLRVALLVGTSSGGMESLSRALELRGQGAAIPAPLARASFYDGPLAALTPWFGPEVPAVTLLGACVASTFALGLGCRWLEAGHADLVIAGGYDAVALMVAVGFEALGATTASAPRPFASGRDGMALGEGAALVALMRSEDAPCAEAHLAGFGATSDAAHVTAPDRSGAGLARAARLALDEAGVAAAAIDLVSAHATATQHNDAAEAAALTTIFGAELPHVPVHALKATIGHTLGGAGALEALAAIDSARAGILPGTAGVALEPGSPVRLLARHAAGSVRRTLKLSAAFGGANAALVLASDTPPARARPLRQVTLLGEGPLVVAPDLELLARRSRLDELRRDRLDRASALALTAAALVLDAAWDPATTAVVVGTFAASLEAVEVFDSRLRERGVKGVEPRRFPATSPNLPAGWCTIAFGWLGPSIAVGGGPAAEVQALAVGYDLVAAGDAERVVVISCNDLGDVTRDLCRAAGLEPPADGARARVLGCEPGGRAFERPELGHR
jgi:3-oxoacyl-[acyl-carrier-protein] synthase-1/3-oxoacyl-[acyl-carrier-protein] synthase II